MNKRAIAIYIAVATMGMISISSRIAPKTPRNANQVMLEAQLEMANEWLDLADKFHTDIDNIINELSNAEFDQDLYDIAKYHIDNQTLKFYPEDFESYNLTGLPEDLKDAGMCYANASINLEKHLKYILKEDIVKGNRYLQSAKRYYESGIEYQLDYLSEDVL